MKKYIVFFIMFSVLISMTSFLADITSQNMSYTQSTIVALTITPPAVTFTIPLSNGTSTGNTTVMNPTGSNGNITITATVSGDTIYNSLILDGTAVLSFSKIFICGGNTTSCDYSATSENVIPTINIPANLKAGTHTGTITYTIVGSP